jgi:ribosomal protein S18 acetylase RimI-like enzyme
MTGITMNGLLKISTLPPASADDDHLTGIVTNLVNEVYAAAEQGLWLDGTDRTTSGEVAQLIRAREITVARDGNRTVGCIRIQQLDSDTGEFGMLAAAPDQRRTGIGRQLVRFAEREILRSGRGVMQLELLVPRTWKHPSKEFLAGWYRRIGYSVTRRGTIDESYPQLAPRLATACDFVVYHKDLKAFH